MSESNGADCRRILISGAGIAGLTAAYWLVKQGCEVVVLEKADTLRKGEYLIDFAGTGWDVAARMGMEAELRRCHVPIQNMCFKNGAGKEKARVKMESFIASMGVSDKYAALNRCDLEELLHDLVKDDIELRFNASIASIEELEDGVDVVLDDGTAERYDLLIGADGLHSNVRSLVYGDESQFTRYLGYQVASFRLPGYKAAEPQLFEMLRVPNKQAGIADLGTGDALAYFIFGQEKDAYVPRAKRKQVLLDVYGEMGGPIPDILAQIDDSYSIYMDSATQISLPSWHQKRVVLIGDAAYCLTLISGQGASMAMGGAYALAEALATQEDLPTALAHYEARLRPFVEELQVKAAKFAGSFVPSSRLGIWLTETAVSWMDFSWVRRLVSKQFTLQSLFDREALLHKP